MSERSLVVLGAGGHGKVCASLADASGRFARIAFSDAQVGRGAQVLRWPVAYHDEDLPSLAADTTDFFIGLGQTGTGAARERLYGWLRDHEMSIATIVAASAIVDASARVGAGTLVGQRAIVQPSATIGVNCILNSNALLEHDAVVGDHVHVSTGAIVNGGARIGARCLIGSGAVVNHGVSVCADAIVGSGATVVADIVAPGVYVGVPARRSMSRG